MDGGNELCTSSTDQRPSEKVFAKRSLHRMCYVNCTLEKVESGILMEKLISLISVAQYLGIQDPKKKKNRKKIRKKKPDSLSIILK